MTARLIGAFALMLLVAVAPVFAQDTPAEPDGTIELDSGGNADAAILQRIRSILDELDGYDNVSVSVQAGVVTLSGRVLDGEAGTRLETLVNRVEGVVAIENQVTESTDLAERLTPAYERIITRAAQMLALVPLILVALTAFVIVTGLGFFIARLKRPWDRIAPNEFIADLYRQVIRIAFLVGGLVIALDILGATALLGTILGAAGLIGLAIGFAVKDTVENFIASIMLSIRQPFRPNDLIEIGGDTGKVIRLTSRATLLLSQDGNHIRIPNATVFGSRIVNFTRNAERRFLFDLSIDASCDLSAARDLCQDTLQKLPFVLATPSPLVWIETIDDAGIVMRLTGWVDQEKTSYFLARGEAIRQTKAAL
ncbi:MAG: mechanosensitive ion channel domain-containing protein, partial [Paracoccaceae bacterium]